MRRLLYCKRAALLALLAAALCGCSRREPAPQGAAQGRPLKVMATFYPLYVMLMNITAGADGVELALLAPADTGCLHDYQLTTRDMKALEDCDILVANGAGMEDFLNKALEAKADAMIVAAEGYPLVDGNAHVWVSPGGAAYEVDRIAQGLARLDAPRAAVYLANAAAYAGRLEALGADMHRTLDAFAGSRIITFHEAFPYFAEEFHLEVAAVIEREPGTAPSPRELEEVVAAIRGVQAGGGEVALFAEPQYASSAADIIASETGLAVYELDPAVTGAADAEAYLNAMRGNMDVLRAALER